MKAVINLAHLLDLTVVAEGVETADQVQHLDSLGCDAYQGYYFAHPMTGHDLELVLNADLARSPAHQP